ncbi:YhbY family RNA-binding protein [Sulfuracidifex metallicus]|uniref:RNA-binding protein n=1 Tax=Sulfuracidifex metallicus DSM 6482 = JCM 9184 TaxID=523847 RepID=A0A6A9QJ97_SULME|nr:YhbY family RNA-binding protein [Sulfuracidifex metallicus]MUN29357.1 RNA-binding protein [Sulfuracidifex metallicus DSM 6482 = JCM 9184]
MTSEDLVKKVRASHSTLRIGKNGVNDGLINEVNRRLKQEKVIKIKVATEDDVKEIAAIVSEKTKAKLIEIRGFTFILAKDDSF